MHQTEKLIYLNLDEFKFDNVALAILKTAKNLNIEKSSITNKLMERKLTKVIEKNLNKKVNNKEYLQQEQDFVNIKEAYNSICKSNWLIKEERDNFLVENLDQKKKQRDTENQVCQQTKEQDSLKAAEKEYKLKANIYIQMI